MLSEAHTASTYLRSKCLPRVGPFFLASSMMLCVSPALAQAHAGATHFQPVNGASPAIEAPQPQMQVALPCSAQAPLSSSDIPLAYTPLSTHCKFELFVRQTYSPYTLASVTFEATWAQAMAQWPQYGGGMVGWSRRLGATVADTESRRFIQGVVLSSAFHQDPRYFPSGQRHLVVRAWYAATRVLVTRADDGRSELNTSELLGAISTSSLQNLYYPSQYRTAGDTMNRFFGALSSDAISDVLHEFTPDMKRMFHKHAPKRILQIEAKVPLPPQDKW